MPKQNCSKQLKEQRAYALIVVLSILAVIGTLIFLWANYLQRLSEQKSIIRAQVESEQVCSYATRLAVSQLQSAIETEPYCVFQKDRKTYISTSEKSIELTSEPISKENASKLVVTKDKQIKALEFNYGVQDYKALISWSIEDQNHTLGQNLELEETKEGYNCKSPEKIKVIPLPRNSKQPAITLGTPRSNQVNGTIQSLKDGITKIDSLAPYSSKEAPFDIISNRTLYNMPMLKQIPDSAQNATDPNILQNGVPLGINPIPVDIKLTGSFFHTQHDDLHRFRFFMDSIWWNPYPLPIDFGDEDRAYIIVWEMLPQWEITNEYTGEVLSFDLSHLPIEDTDNSKNEITPHAWMTFKSAYIREGEIYAIQEPSQPEGLARTLSTSKWIYSKNGWKPQKIWGNNWIANSHNILIKPISAPKARIRIYPYTEKLADNQTIEDYGTPILEIRNISFEYPDMELTGEQYSIENSTEFTRSDCRIQWQIHLKDSAEDLQNLFNLWDSRCPVWDLDDPVIASLFEVGFRTCTEPGKFNTVQQHVFYDSEANSHTTSNKHRIFDAITKLPESIGSFRALCFPNYPPLCLGAQGGVNQLFDEVCATSVDEPGFHASLNVNTITEDTWKKLLQRSFTRFPSLSKKDDSLPSVTITKTQASELSEYISRTIKETTPFPSLKAFYDTDIFNKALKETGINLTSEEVLLNGSDIAGTLSPLLSVRSDSFRAYIAIELYRKEQLIARQNREVILQVVYEEGSPKVKVMSIRPVTYEELN